jgi:serine phosphatase RsbU (regulator of sigma subunit)
MSKKAMSKAMSAELKSVSDPPKQRSQRAAYGLCDHRRLNVPAGVARDSCQGGTGVRQGHGANMAWSDSCDIRQLALGAASEVCPLEVLAGQEALFGSDFADVIPLGEGRIALALGDVGVTGLPAALCVPQVLHTLRRILRKHVQPACVLDRLNLSLCRSGLPAGCLSVALSLLVVDVETGKTECACAGSEPPLILRADGGAEAVNSGRVSLGVDFGQTYRTVDFLLEKGDALLLATDGITKAGRTNCDGGSDFLSYEGLVGLAVDAFGAGRPPGQVAKMVLDGARAFAGGPLQNDACVLVAIRQ